MITLSVFSSAVIVILLHWYWVKKANKLQRIKLIFCLFFIVIFSLGITYMYRKNSYSLPKEEMKQKAIEIVKNYKWFQPYKDEVALTSGNPDYHYTGSLLASASDDEWNMFFDRLMGGRQLYMITIGIEPPIFTNCTFNAYTSSRRGTVNSNLMDKECSYPNRVTYVNEDGSQKISKFDVVIDRWGNDASNNPQVNWKYYSEEFYRILHSNL